MTSATKDQPFPTHSTGPDVTSLVRDDLELRAQKGLETYGSRLKPFNGRNAQIDAYQEALDLAVYFKQRLIEEEEFIAQLDKAISLAKESGSDSLVGLVEAKKLYDKFVTKHITAEQIDE